MSDHLARSRGSRRLLRRSTVGVVALYACLMGFLVVALWQEDRSFNVPLAVLFGSGVCVAAILAAVRSRWPAWLAVTYSLVTTLADAPHQLAELAHPTGHAAVSVFILLVGLAAVVLSLALALKAPAQPALATSD